MTCSLKREVTGGNDNWCDTSSATTVDTSPRPPALFGLTSCDETHRDATICPGPRGAHSPPPQNQLQSCRHGPELARSDSEHD
ncbi:unnamed protein product [Lota lota]